MKINFWLGMAISAVIIFFFARNVDLAKMAIAFKGANYAVLIFVVIIFVASVYVRAHRWRYLLRPVKRIGTMPVFSATSIGFMANMLLPARLGEFVRAYVIGDKENISKSSSLATIVVERLFDGLTVILILVPLLLLVQFPEGAKGLQKELRFVGILSALFYAGIIGFCIFLNTNQERAMKVVAKVTSPLPRRISQRICSFIESFAAGLRVIRHKKLLAIAFLFSGLTWVMSAASNLIVLFAFNLSLPLYAPFLLTVAQAFGVMLPSSPGFIGTFHAASIAGFAFFGVGFNTALSISIVMHALSFFPTVALGLACLWAERLSFRKISRLDEGGVF